MDTDIRIPQHGYLSQWPVSPQIITGWFVRFLQWKFSATRNINNSQLKTSDILWKPDDTLAQNYTKKILVGTVNEYDPTDAQQRPAVMVRRGGTNLAGKMSLGDRYHVPTNLLAGGTDPNIEATMGHDQQVVGIAGSHTLFCIADTGGAAEVLGIDVWTTLIDFMHVARKDLKLDEFRVGELRPVGKLKEATDAWVVPIMVNYSYQRNTVVKLESPVLKAFTVDSQLK